jgi:GTP-binding protein
MQAFSDAHFLRATSRPGDFPPADAPELAFAGRSNVGKSSAINALLGRRSLARTSKTPGRTQTINFYDLGSQAGAPARLVDLPGYGYARVAKPLRDQWRELVGAYLQERAGLAAVVLVMDARHPLMPLDQQLLAWLGDLRVLALLSKADKLGRLDQQRALKDCAARLAGTPNVRVALFSSVTRQGVEESRDLLWRWLFETSARAGGGNKRPPVKGM